MIEIISTLFILFVIVTIFTTLMGFITNIFWCITRVIKVDYSIASKKDRRFNEYSVYIKKHFWNRWKEEKVFSDPESAEKYAKFIKTKYPKYF